MREWISRCSILPPLTKIYPFLPVVWFGLWFLSFTFAGFAVRISFEREDAKKTVAVGTITFHTTHLYVYMRFMYSDLRLLTLVL